MPECEVCQEEVDEHWKRLCDICWEEQWVDTDEMDWGNYL